MLYSVDVVDGYGPMNTGFEHFGSEKFWNEHSGYSLEQFEVKSFQSNILTFSRLWSFSGRLSMVIPIVMPILVK